ncbi:MAG: hypothetical protein Q4E47_01780 [Candidatus Saccharibacteria bacterium]|nr:hypothetical protein [Candidatus Saccharibacteria bacterium]
MILSNKIVRDHSAEQYNTDEILHTSAYAQAQANGSTMGAASPSEMLDVAKRQSIDQQRKYIQSYKNSKIMASAYALRKAQSITPRTAGGKGAVANVAPDGSLGNVRTSYGRTSGSGSMSRADAVRAKFARSGAK